MSTFDYTLRLNAGTAGGTITLTTSPWQIENYQSLTPGLEDTSIAESAHIRLMDGSGTANLDELHNIQKIFYQAQGAQENKSNKVYLEWLTSGSTDIWRSEVIDGRAELDPEAINKDYWEGNTQFIMAYWERQPFWEGTQVQIPLTNGNGSADTSGLAIFNHDDGGGTAPTHHDNWVDIAGTYVTGDIPGATLLEVVNTYATGRLFTLWIGQNWTDPDNFSHIIEGESSSTGTATSNATCSGAYSVKATLSTTAEADMFTWALTDAFLDTCQGQYFKILTRYPGAASTDVKYRIKLQYLGSTIWQSGQMILDTSRAYAIRDLFTLRLPPWLLGQTNLKALSMIMTGQAIAAPPLDVYIDFLQITPLDGWRMLECAGYGVAQNSRMVDDGVNEDAYIDNGSGDDKAGILIGFGNPIGLYPGKKQRLYFLMHSATGDTAEIDRSATVKLYYRPRRQTL